ncbi:MAG: hypothetical protein QM820_06000 [Minicystis sp.]
MTNTMLGLSAGALVALLGTGGGIARACDTEPRGDRQQPAKAHDGTGSDDRTSANVCDPEDPGLQRRRLRAGLVLADAGQDVQRSHRRGLLHLPSQESALQPASAAGQGL